MRRRRDEASIRVFGTDGQPMALESGKTYPGGTRVEVETPHYRGRVATEGYVSGLVAGSFEDRETGARDLGFGLHVADFLLEPAPADEPVPEGQYEFGRGNRVHGTIAKRYVEGPQICTRARRLAPTVIRGDGFSVVHMKYTWTDAYPPHDRPGSVWEQTLIFPDRGRYFLSSDRVTTTAESPCLFFRIDMPGHIKLDGDSKLEHVYLSYEDTPTIPSTEFGVDFPPEARFLYERDDEAIPDRFIRGYQPRGGPWLAGMTLEPSVVHEAWCHRRGYVCMIQEIGGRAASPGDTIDAAYVIGWFDDAGAMNEAFDRHRGTTAWAFDGPFDRPTGYRPA